MNNLRGQARSSPARRKGLGYAIAKHTSPQGMKVALMDVRGDILTQEVAAEFTDAGGDALAITVDLSDADDTKPLLIRFLHSMERPAS